MTKTALYSRSTRPRDPRAPAHAADGDAAGVPAGAAAAPPAPRPRWRATLARHERWLLVAAAGIVALAVVLGNRALTPPARPLTQDDIDAAVLHTLATVPMPSTGSKAYEAVRRSVVRVRGQGHETEREGKMVEGIGSGVVIVDTGVILTNLHVVAGASDIEVEFDDGTEERGDRHRRAARARSGGAAGQDDPGRPARGDAALDRRSAAGRRGRRRRLSVRDRAVGIHRGRLRPRRATTTRPRASACCPT